MKKIYFLTLTFGLIFFGLNSANAQDFPWPDLGEAMIIEPGAPGTINETIHADTSATGERLHNHYILRRGQTYLYTARIQNTGYPLMVTAEDGDGELPIIKALGPAEGEDEAERPFHAEGDLYLKDITINGFDQGGNYTDNATVRLAADGITVVLKGVNLDFNRQNSIRINAVDCELYVEDCVIGNQGVAARLWQGFAVHFRGNWTPLVHMRNNTIYNMHNNIISNRNEKRYGKLVFENNTVMNTGTNGADFGRPDELVVKNNLFVNVGILGDGFLGDRETFVEPWYYFAVDSNFTDTTNTTLLDPVVDFSNNRFYLDPAVAELLPDSSDKSTETLIHPYLLSLIDEATNIIADEAFSFTNFPATIGEYESYINDFFAFSDDPAEMPQFDTDIRTLDFGYPETHAAYTAGTDGGPIGDLNWLGGAVGINDYRYEAFNVYPNPVSGVIKVNLKKDQNIDKVVITNILGQDVKVVSSINSKQFEIDARELNTGIYFVNFYKNERFLGTNKILKK